MLVSASSDKTIRVWSIETFNQIQYDDRHEAQVTALHANARHIMSGAADAKIKVNINRFTQFSNAICISFSYGNVSHRTIILNKKKLKSLFFLFLKINNDDYVKFF